MARIRVEIRNGTFVPLDDISHIQAGEEHQIVVMPALPPDEPPSDALAPFTQEEIDGYKESLDRTRGMWSDVDIDLEKFVDELREQENELWQQRLRSLGIL